MQKLEVRIEPKPELLFVSYDLFYLYSCDLHQPKKKKANDRQINTRIEFTSRGLGRKLFTFIAILFTSTGL